MGQISKFGLSANITLARLKLKPGREDQEGWDRKGTGRGDRGVNGEWGTNIRLLFGGGGALNDRALVLCLVTGSTNTFTLLDFKNTRDNIDTQ